MRELSRGLKVALGLSCALAACGGGAKREAAALAGAVDRYRRAENSSKASMVDAVVAVACSDGQVCAAKEACLAAIQPTVRALVLKDGVASCVSDLEGKRLSPDSPEAQALPGKLNEAERLLKQGHALMGDCEKKLADRRAYHGVRAAAQKAW